MAKTLIEGSDYFLHFLKFANRANPAVCVENPDGTFDIYCNTLYDEFALRTSLQHEFVHIAGDHLFLDLPVQCIENAADSNANRVRIIDCGAVVSLKTTATPL